MARHTFYHPYFRGASHRKSVFPGRVACFLYRWIVRRRGKNNQNSPRSKYITHRSERISFYNLPAHPDLKTKNIHYFCYDNQGKHHQ